MPETESKTIRVTVSIDTDELRKWADWHADRGQHGVAHVLYKAASDGESLTEQATREAKASAWDEGFETRTDWRKGPDAFPPSNPYRANTTTEAQR